LALARLLLAQPDILLLDEPTNHLDVAAVEWLEDFLAEYSKAFVIVSHDRFLLDRTTTKVVEIDAGIANVYAGNYTAYVRQREERRAAQARQYRQQQQLVGRTEEFIRRNLAGQKTKQAKSRRNMLERLDRVEAVKTERIGSFGFRKIARTGDNVLAVSHLVIGYGRHPLTSEISVLVRRGDRLGIIGANASGKTSFLKTVMGKIEPISGGFTWGANVLPGYFDQDLSGLNPSSTVFEELSRIAPGATAGELRSYLAMFLFTGDEVSKQVSVLSGGEQSRLALARLIYGSANVLVLDEPTNHLDIPSREALEQALGEYPGTIIVVSHDRYFLDRIATEILHFEDHKVTHHRGSYSEYYAIRHHLEPARGDSPPRRKPEKPSRKRPEAAKKPRVRPAAAIEEEIHGLEQEMEELSNRLSNPEPGWGGDQYAEFAARREELSSRLEELYREWDLTEAPDAINSSPGKP
jgi:ATP-binding cassette subfamily F protein 3